MASQDWRRRPEIHFLAKQIEAAMTIRFGVNARLTDSPAVRRKHHQAVASVAVSPQVAPRDFDVVLNAAYQ